MTEGTQGGVECSKGDNSIVFLGFNGEIFGLWKMPLDGGEAIPLPNTTRFRPSISPDGTKMAYTYWDPRLKQMSQEIIELNSSQPADVLIPKTVERFSLPLTAVGEYAQNEPSVRWTRNGNLSFINEEKGVSNIWLKPLKGNEIKKVTSFTENSIFRYDWNSEGNKLAVTRYSTVSDVAVIRIGN
jgi:Tol biopolymer transport system component